MEPTDRAFAFGSFRYERPERLLGADGAAIRLTPKTADILLALLQSRGRLLTKNELIERVWPDTAVEDGSLTYHIHLLRQALGDSAEQPTYIQTVPRRGYRFLAPVIIIKEPPAAPEIIPAVVPAVTNEIVAAEPSPIRERSGSRLSVAAQRAWRRRGRIAAFVLSVSVAAVAVSRRDPPMPSVTGVTQLTHDGRAKSGLVLTDGARLLYQSPIGQRWLNVDGSAAETPAGLKDFQLVDYSAATGEALALRPNDRGAEHGLWIVKLRDDPGTRVAEVLSDGYAAWSSDASRVATIFEKQLRITDRFGANQVLVATPAGLPTCPRWSPDDRSVRVTLNARSDRQSVSSLFDVAASGDSPAQLTGFVLDGGSCGRWMPNGRDYVFQAAPEGYPRVWVHREARGTRLGGEARAALTPEGLRFTSPLPNVDGTRVFVIGQRFELTRFDVSANAFVPLLAGIPAYALDYSRDGRRVAYVSRTDLTLWRARVDGSEPQQLTFPPLRVEAVSWSPDGTSLALRAGMPGKRAKVYLMKSSGGPATPLTDDDVEQGHPTWSPDGRRLAFGDIPETFGKPTGSEVINIHDLATGRTDPLPGSGKLWSSRWSPDGRYIAALTADTKELRLHVLADGTWRKTNARHASHLSWSRDGDYVYLDPEGPAQSLRRVRIADGAVETVLDLRDYLVPWASVAPDGSPLVFRTLTDIYAIELEYR